VFPTLQFNFSENHPALTFLAICQDLSGFHAPNALRTQNWDSLEKALTVFILPDEGANKTGTPRHIHSSAVGPDLCCSGVLLDGGGWMVSLCHFYLLSDQLGVVLACG